MTIAIVVADRFSKRWVESSVEPWESIPVIPGLFQIVHTRNRGMAFGVFNENSTDLSRWVLVVISLVVLGLLAWFIRRAHRDGQAVPVPFYLVMSGALGNLYDRIVYGSVTDFMDLYAGDHHWPTFNIADAAITVGALWLLWLSWREGRASKAAEA